MDLPRRHRLTPLALAFLAIPAAAQQQTAKGPEPTRIEVTGFRSSLESAPGQSDTSFSSTAFTCR